MKNMMLSEQEYYDIERALLDAQQPMGMIRRSLGRFQQEPLDEVEDAVKAVYDRLRRIALEHRIY